MQGQDNLIPFNELTEEEQRKIARMGGIASGEARRQKKLIKDQLKLLLSLPIKDDNFKKELEEMGIDEENQDNQMALVVSLYQKALNGDVQAFNTIRDSVGEKPKEEIEISRDTEDAAKEIGEYLCKKKKS